MLKKKMCGYSLLELLIVLALTTLLLIAAVPTWRTLTANTSAITYMNQLHTAINMARTEAIKQGTTVTLCKSADQKSCSGNWSDGQIIFVDKNATGVVSDPRDVIARFPGASAGHTVVWKGLRSHDYLQFGPDGMTRGQHGSFIYCPADKDTRYARALIISQTGRARLSNDNDHDGVYEDDAGQPLTCP